MVYINASQTYGYGNLLDFKYREITEKWCRKQYNKMKKMTFIARPRSCDRYCWSICRNFLIHCFPVCIVSSWSVKNISLSLFLTSTLFSNLCRKYLTGTAHSWVRNNQHQNKWSRGLRMWEGWVLLPLTFPHETHPHTAWNLSVLCTYEKFWRTQNGKHWCIP